MVRIEGIPIVMRRLVEAENKKASETKRQRPTPLKLPGGGKPSGRRRARDPEPKIA